MKVVFLDFDGVLNASTSPDFCIERVFVERLNRIIAKTGAHVVLSTTWRIAEPAGYCERCLAECGFIGTVLGSTPSIYIPGLASVPRGREIQAWLDRNPTVEAFVILDDDSDMEHLLPRLVRTAFKDGLQDHEVEKAVALLT